MHDSATCPVCRGSSGGNSLTDREFNDFLVACRDEFAVKQAQFLCDIADATRWTYEMEDGSITIGAAQFGMTPIGTFSTEQEFWLWVWANESFPRRARESAERMRVLQAVTGFKVFAQAGIPASAADAQDFAAMAVHQLEAIGLFRSPHGGTVLYMAVHERRN